MIDTEIPAQRDGREQRELGQRRRLAHEPLRVVEFPGGHMIVHQAKGTAHGNRERGFVRRLIEHRMAACQPRRMEIAGRELQPRHHRAEGFRIGRQPGPCRIIGPGEIGHDGFRLAEDNIAVDQDRQAAARVEGQQRRRDVFVAGEHVDRDLAASDAERREQQAYLVAVLVEFEVVEHDLIRRPCARQSLAHSTASWYASPTVLAPSGVSSLRRTASAQAEKCFWPAPR